MSVRMVIAFISQKMIAVWLGPEGVAILGNVRNIIPMIESFSTLGTFNGIVKYVAAYKNDKKELHKLFSTVTFFSIIASCIAFLVLFFGADYLNKWLFLNQYQFAFVFKILAVSVPFLALNRIFNGVMNGLSAYKKYVNINLFAYASSVVFLLLAVYYKSLNGALVAIALTPVLQFSILFYFYFKVLKRYINFKNIRVKNLYGNTLVGFTIMSLVATFLGGFVDINLRTHLMKTFDAVDAGNWTGMTNISKQYLMFSSAIFTLYVIPKFAIIDNSKTFRKEILNIYKTLLPLFAVGMLSIYFLREWVIIIAKSKEFLGMMPLFKWQLLGDFVKIASVIVAHQFLAKKMVKVFVFTEILSLILFYSFAHLLTPSMGAEGVVLAHFLRYIVYYIVVIFLLRKHIFGNHKIKM